MKDVFITCWLLKGRKMMTLPSPHYQPLHIPQATTKFPLLPKLCHPLRPQPSSPPSSSQRVSTPAARRQKGPSPKGQVKGGEPLRRPNSSLPPPPSKGPNRSMNPYKDAGFVYPPPQQPEVPTSAVGVDFPWGFGSK